MFSYQITHLLFYFVILVLNIILFRKQFTNPFYLLIIILFNPAFFYFIGGKGLGDFHKILSLVLTIWVASKGNAFTNFKKGDGLITIAFILFSFVFFMASWINEDGFTITLSQFSRYLIAYCLWFIVRKFIWNNQTNLEELNHFVYKLILIQILISIAKLIIFRGSQIEGLVGTIAVYGGAAGTTIPILGFIVLWFVRKGQLTMKDWLFVAGLMLIGYTTGKRAVWFILPFVIAAFMIYVPRLKLNKTIIVVILLSPLVFYFGVRLTPTLNPERTVWGSFNLDYVLDYAQMYQFGKETEQKYEYEITTNDQIDRAQGRGGATLELTKRFFDDEAFTERDYWGVGATSMYTLDYQEFSDLDLSVKLNHKGSATGLFQTYVTNGYLGIFTTLFFFLSMLFRIKMRRLRWVIIVVVLWEYFMYTGLIFRTPAFMFLIIYFIHYSNFLVFQQKEPKALK